MLEPVLEPVLEPARGPMPGPMLERLRRGSCAMRADNGPDRPGPVR
jgi:hypothetical protein